MNYKGPYHFSSHQEQQERSAMTWMLATEKALDTIYSRPKIQFWAESLLIRLTIRLTK